MRIQPVARGLDFEKVGSPCDRSQANSIAKGSTITWFRKVRVRLVGLPLAIALLFPALGQDLPVPVARSSQDSLNLSEEEYAYAANSPAARVTAFLRIADNKILAAKRLQKSNPNASLTESLKGYYAAMQGASLGVSWGRELGEDMRRHNAAIAKIARDMRAFLSCSDLAPTFRNDRHSFKCGIFSVLKRPRPEDAVKQPPFPGVSIANRSQAPLE